LRILIKDHNDGYGSGIMFGVNESSADLVGWAHADLQFDPSQIVENLNYITKNLDKDEEILIVGERLNRSLVDVIFTKGMSLAVWLFTRIYIRDINSQPKIFSNSLLKKLYILPSDFNLDLHIFLKARKLSCRIIRIKLSFKDRVFESAKGGGTIYGKIKLTYSVLKYLFAKSFDD
jgi:glycosyltransferase involved in cell wall biosynthesis